MKTVILFTAIFDNYDKLNEVSLPPNWRAICFTNTDIESKTWEIVKVEKHEKIYRDIKIRPHIWLPEHDRSIWIDGNLEIEIPLEKFLKDKHDGVFTLMDHPDRNCVYQEAQRCIELGKDSADVINKQIARYRELGLEEQSGLFATGCIIRNDIDAHNDFNDRWWKEVRGGSCRDQISFPYVWQTRMFVTTIDTFPFLKDIKYHYHIHKEKELEERRRRKMKFKKARVTDAYRKLYGR